MAIEIKRIEKWHTIIDVDGAEKAYNTQWLEKQLGELQVGDIYNTSVLLNK